MPDTNEIATYQRLFTEKFQELEELLAELPAEALLWKPFESSPWQGPCNSLGEIVAHGVSSTVYLLRRAEWIMGRIEWEEVDGDEGRTEFGPANHDVAYLRARVGRTQDFVNAFLTSLSADDLPGSRVHPRRAGLQLSVRYDVQHAIEHLSQHIGHAHITRQLWALQA